jgi:anti-sigma factor (TIGR02949 family)
MSFSTDQTWTQTSGAISELKTAPKDAQTCLNELFSILDGKKAGNSKEEFAKHLEACVTCYEAYNLEATIQKLMRDTLERKCVPTGLIDQIKGKISQPY